MPSPNSSTKPAHTVKHHKRAYLVICPEAVIVAIYRFDPSDFQARRQAWREALADAALRDENAERAAVSAYVQGAA